MADFARCHKGFHHILVAGRVTSNLAAAADALIRLDM
jgi:hypothetical protein